MSSKRALALLFVLFAGPAACQAQDEAQPRSDRSAAAAPVDPDALGAAAFAPERLRARRQALLDALPAGSLVVLVASEPVGDTWPYRPDPDFLYLSGVREPGFALLLGPETDLLLAPAKDPGHELWNGPRVAPGQQGTGFEAVADRAGLNERLRALLGGATGLFLGGIEAAALDLPEGAPPVEPVAGPLHALRQVKDEHELALLQRAIDITGAALVEAMRSARPGQAEYELQAVIEYLFARHGAQRPGFASIVGSGPNSCVLHYQANRRRVREGDLVVMDVGAELFGYTADVTRTIPVGGKFSPRQREIYELVLRAQEAAFAAVKPGVTLREVDQAARQVIRQAGLAQRFPHGTSHWLGMDVHDVGAYSRRLEPGMVLTVEPGVYLADEELGVRIEDDVVVTADGCRILTAAIPRRVEDVERLCARGDGVGARPAEELPARPAPAPARRRVFQLGPR